MAIVDIGTYLARLARIGMLHVSEGADTFSPAVLQWFDKRQTFPYFCER
jgi:hypothetical protein